MAQNKKKSRWMVLDKNGNPVVVGKQNVYQSEGRAWGCAKMTCKYSLMRIENNRRVHASEEEVEAYVRTKYDVIELIPANESPMHIAVSEALISNCMDIPADTLAVDEAKEVLAELLKVEVQMSQDPHITPPKMKLLRNMPRLWRCYDGMGSMGEGNTPTAAAAAYKADVDKYSKPFDKDNV